MFEKKRGYGTAIAGPTERNFEYLRLGEVNAASNRNNSPLMIATNAMMFRGKAHSQAESENLCRRVSLR